MSAVCPGCHRPAPDCTCHHGDPMPLVRALLGQITALVRRTEKKR